MHVRMYIFNMPEIASEENTDEVDIEVPLLKSTMCSGGGGVNHHSCFLFPS